MAIGRLQNELERQKGRPSAAPVLVNEEGGVDPGPESSTLAPSASAAGGGGDDGGATTFLTEAGFAGGARGQAEPLRNERILEILQSENLDAA